MVYQTETMDCGKACVRDVLYLAYEDEAFRVASLTERCETFGEILRELKRFGLDYVAYEADVRDGLDKENLPAIALTEQAGKAHFVVLRKVTKRVVLLDDPEFGEIRLTQEEFRQVFRHRLLLREGKGSRPACPRVRYFRKREILAFGLLFLLLLASSVLAFHALGNSESLVLSLAGFVSFLLCLGLLFLALQRTRRRFDSDYFLPFLEFSRDRRDAAFLGRYLDGKIRTVVDMVAYSLVLFLLLLLIVANGTFYILVGVLGLLFALFAPLERRERNRVNRSCSIQEEGYLASLKGRGADEKGFLVSRKKASGYLTRRVLFQLSKHGIVAMVILAFMAIDGQAGLNYFFFAFFLAFSVETSASRLFLAGNDETEERLLNSLSASFPAFLLKKQLLFRYNRRKEANGDGDRHP